MTGENKRRGVLIVNSFADSQKLRAHYLMLEEAAKRRNIDLLTVKSADLMFPSGGAKQVGDFALLWDKDTINAENLELAGVRVFNSARATELAFNKAKSMLALSKCDGIRIPKTFFSPKSYKYYGYPDLSFLEKVEDEIGYPMVIKGFFGSYGLTVRLASSRGEAVGIIKDEMGFDGFLMQEFISSSRGVDIRANVVGNEVPSCMMRSNENDFRSNISNGGVGSKFKPDRSFIEAAISAKNALGLDFAGVDILIGAHGEPVICEVNAFPHFKSSIECTGVDLAEEIMSLAANEVYGVSER